MPSTGRPATAANAAAYLHEPCGAVMTARWVEETNGACGGCEYVGMQGWTPLHRPATGITVEDSFGVRAIEYETDPIAAAEASAASSSPVSDPCESK